jgi:hypothetical protein
MYFIDHLRIRRHLAGPLFIDESLYTEMTDLLKRLTLQFWIERFWSAKPASRNRGGCKTFSRQS